MTQLVPKSTLRTKLGLSDWTMTRLLEEQQIVPATNENGKDLYDLDAAKQVVAARKAATQVDKARPNKALDLTTARIDKLKAETKRLEYRLQKEKEKVIPIEEVGDIVSREYELVRARLLSIPNNIAPAIAGLQDVGEIAKLIRREVVEALDELSSNK